jgi:hypothetical protein
MRKRLMNSAKTKPGRRDGDFAWKAKSRGGLEREFLAALNLA